MAPFKLPVAVILALTLAVAAANAVEPLILKLIFDELGAARRADALTRAVVGLVALGLLREALTALSNWLTWRTRLRVHYRLLEASVGRLHSLPITFHQAEGVGATMTKLDRGIQGFVGAFTEVAFNVVPALVYLVLSVVVMIELDWRLAVAVIAFAPFPALIAAWAAPEQTRRERTLLDRWAKIYSRFNEVLSGIVTVKSFAMEEDEKRRFLCDVDRANRVVERGVGIDSGVGAAQNLVVMLARIAALAVGAWLVLRGQVTLGTLIAFLGYVSGLFGPVQGLSSVYKTLHRASVSLDIICAVLDAEDSLGDAPDARDPGRLRGEIAFHGVHFAHDPARPPILAGIDLEVRAGETVALVGPSGAGKTTMMALLQRFYDPTRGRITVDGVDLRGLKQRAVRQQIGVVLQDALLFNDTIRNNIAYGRPGAAMVEIAAAARAANAAELIARLPDGYETVVGERGSRLSAGERQRVAIARALLKDPPILVFDEATSALDAESEALVQEAILRLVKGRTTFIIAHRLSTVVAADRILVLRDGRIAEAGRHQDLVSSGGYYAMLVERQVGGLLKVA